MTVETPIIALSPCKKDEILGPPLTMAGPCAPKITAKDLLWQFKKDVYGKEIQAASTYSHTWMATQFGHICIGMAAGFVLRAISYLLGISASPGQILLIGSMAASFYELKTYLWSVKKATGRFRFNDKHLRNNAIIAAAYVIIGLGASVAFQQLSASWVTTLWVIISVLALVVLAIILAIPWLRQKIIWQKAALPYLFRIADAKPSIADESAKQLQDLIDNGGPASQTPPRQIVIGGPIGSGRTSLAAGIGTEFAFKKTKVRYLSLNTLLECAVRSSNSEFYDDMGPENIRYWGWSEAQVVIIDDIGPFLGAAKGPDQGVDLEKFRQLIQHDLVKVKGVLGKCHTVWVTGSLFPDGAAETGEMLKELAPIVAGFCEAQQCPVVVELSDVPVAAHRTGARPGLNPVVRHAVLHRVLTRSEQPSKARNALFRGRQDIVRFWCYRLWNCRSQRHKLSSPSPT